MSHHARGTTTLYGRVEYVSAGVVYLGPMERERDHLVPVRVPDWLFEEVSQREDRIGLRGMATWDMGDGWKVVSFDAQGLTPYRGDGYTLEEAFIRLRATVGDAFDRIDVRKMTCYDRHDEGCACTGAPVNGPQDYTRP